MKRNTPLRRKSVKKAQMEKQYEVAKLATIVDGRVRCADNGRWYSVHLCEPHHPMGRNGKFILCFVWLLKFSHERIHRFGKQSRALGWLLKPYEGRQYDPTEKRAFPQWAEAHWPEEYQRPKETENKSLQEEPNQ